jgi:pectate lyase
MKRAALVVTALAACAAPPAEEGARSDALSFAGSATSNPSFETGLDGWLGGKSVLARQWLADAPDGAWVARVSATGEASYATIDDAPESIADAAAGRAYVATAYVRAAASATIGKSVHIRIRERGHDGALVKEWSSSAATLTATFQRIAIRATALRDGDTLDVRVSQTDARLGDAFYVDAITFGTPLVLAFPGAEGFGRSTPGGRGGKVFAVTRLDDYAPATVPPSERYRYAGTLRYALEEESVARRFIVFRVGGTIDAVAPIVVARPYTTIAGQTAPGGGIAIRRSGLNVLTHDVIVRGLRTRVGIGTCSTCGDPGDRDGLRVSSASGDSVHDVIFDHCSTSWAADENMSLWNWRFPDNPRIHDVTIQWSISSEALHCSKHQENGVYQCHSMGLLIGDHSRNVSVHHNLFAHDADRNPLVTGDATAEVINNVVYDFNWALKVTPNQTPLPTFVNAIGNWFQAGPDTPSSRRGITVSPDIDAATRIYVRGNVGPGRPADTGDDWLAVSGDPKYRSSSLATAASGITSTDATSAYEAVLARAGATAPKRDAIDAAVVASIRNRTGGIIDRVEDSVAGGFVTYANGAPPPDSDGDGVPDEFERTHGLAPANPSDGNGIAPSGYTWIEEYVNSLF